MRSNRVVKLFERGEGVLSSHERVSHDDELIKG